MQVNMRELQDVSTIRGVNATKPIMVAQFQKTSKCDGGGNTIGDPSMTILNPLEQTLEHITLYSSEYFDIDKSLHQRCDSYLCSEYF